MTKTINGSTYRVDNSTGKIYELDKDKDAYVFFGHLNGRTLEKAVEHIYNVRYDYWFWQCKMPGEV